MERGFSLIELLIIIIIVGVLLLVSVLKFSPVLTASAPARYCNIMRAIRSYLEFKKEQVLINRCYPSSIDVNEIKKVLDINTTDPYTNSPIEIYTTQLSSVSDACPSVDTTQNIIYCPVIVNGCAYSYKLGVSYTIKREVYPGCLIGVDDSGIP